jgi:uncharacterized membrane protein
MAELIAIAYPDETTAATAEAEAQKLAGDLVIQPDSLAVIVCDKDGNFKVATNHHPVGAGTADGMFWGLLFGLLFFIPVLGLAVGAGLGALFGKIEKTGIDQDFQTRVRDALKPGTSALFLVLEKATWDKLGEALAPFGGTVIQSSLSHEGEQELQEALHGARKQ